MDKKVRNEIMLRASQHLVTTTVTCNDCGSALSKQFQGLYGCDSCNAWTKNVNTTQKPFSVFYTPNS